MHKSRKMGLPQLFLILYQNLIQPQTHLITQQNHYQIILDPIFSLPSQIVDICDLVFHIGKCVFHIRWFQVFRRRPNKNQIVYRDGFYRFITITISYNPFGELSSSIAMASFSMILKNFCWKENCTLLNRLVFHLFPAGDLVWIHSRRNLCPKRLVVVFHRRIYHILIIDYVNLYMSTQLCLP